MSAAHDLKLTPEEYLAAERDAFVKSEYFDGRIYQMSGSSRAHNRIALNVAWQLESQFRQRACELFVMDMRLKVNEAGLYTYPDLMVVCGEVQFADGNADTVTNPDVIIEVLSPSTAAYDRGKKFEFYKTLGSLREYLLISQVENRVDQFARWAGSLDWEHLPTTGIQSEIELKSIGCRLRLSEIYHKLELAEPDGSESDRVREMASPDYDAHRSFPGTAPLHTYVEI